MYPFYLELELVKPVSDYFKKQGYSVKYEVRIGFCRADLVCFKQVDTIAVELKLSNWKKAIVQAKNYQLGADYVYIVFPMMKSYNVIRKAENILKKEGIGLLVVNEKTTKVSEIIKPYKSKKKMGDLSKNNTKYKKRKQKYNKKGFF